jgi:X-Pro dipeptidyl-peptidase
MSPMRTAAAVAGLLCVTATPASAATGPVFANGQAQIVPSFQDPSGWIRHDLWVETRFDSDGDGRRDGCTWT